MTNKSDNYIKIPKQVAEEVIRLCEVIKNDKSQHVVDQTGAKQVSKYFKDRM